MGHLAPRLVYLNALRLATDVSGSEKFVGKLWRRLLSEAPKRRAGFVQMPFWFAVTSSDKNAIDFSVATMNPTV